MKSKILAVFALSLAFVGASQAAPVQPDSGKFVLKYCSTFITAADGSGGYVNGSTIHDFGDHFIVYDYKQQVVAKSPILKPLGKLYMTGADGVGKDRLDYFKGLEIANSQYSISETSKFGVRILSFNCAGTQM